MPTLSVLNIQGQEAGTMDLPAEIFDAAVNQDVIHQAIVMYQANQRQGNASTKDRGHVSGGGKKPWRQKGTGRARQGSIRSPLWHKGGVVFGPHPRDFSYEVPQKIRVMALRETLKAKFKDNDLLCIDRIEIPSGKTKDFSKVLAVLKIKNKTLLLLDGNDVNVMRATRNISSVNLVRASDVNAYDILRNKKLLVTEAAFKSLLKRILK